MKNFEANDRLMEFLNKKGISLYRFSKDVSKVTSYAYAIRNKKHPVNEKLIDELKKAYPSLSIDWLLDGKGSMEATKEGNVLQTVNITSQMSLRDELAFKEKTELTNLYWSNSAFQRNIKQVCEKSGVSEVEVSSEMAYENADVIIKNRDKVME